MKTALASMVAIAVGLATGLSLGSALGAQLTSPDLGSPRAELRPAPEARPIPALVMHANPVLGYRIDLPDGYRRSRSLVLPVNREMVGHDAYVNRTEAQELDLCLATKERRLLPPEREHDVRIEAYRDVRGVPAAEWIRLRGMTVVHTTIESLAVNGYDAARVVHQPSGDTAFYVIRANERVYVITRELYAQPSNQPRGWLDQIASTFAAISASEAGPTPLIPPCSR